jgi:hypothetical protein
LGGEYGYFLRFQITQRFNNLIITYNPNSWSEEQQEIHDLIKSLHNGEMGYRKIAQYLNEKGIKTARGNSWRNTQVSSVLKRYDEKMFRQQIAMTKYEPEWSKMWLEFTT